MKTYCPNCHKETFGPHNCDKDIVGRMDTSNANFGDTKKGYAVARDSVYVKEIWNEAIEAAALIADNEWIGRITSDEIRKLKK